VCLASSEGLRRLSLTNLAGVGPCFLWSTLLFISDACCSRALLLWYLSTVTFHSSTTTISTATSFDLCQWGRARTAANLRLARVLVVLVRWSKDPFVIFILFKFLVLPLKIMNGSVYFSKKKKKVSWDSSWNGMNRYCPAYGIVLCTMLIWIVFIYLDTQMIS
jgi:hypothetical protein